MATEAIPRITLVALFLAFGFTRMAYQIRARSAGRSRRMQDNIAAVVAVSVGGLSTVLVTSAYLVQSPWLRWAHLAFPDWLRWAGVLLAACATAMNIWVHRALGTNFSATLRIKEAQTLVTHGPYRWVRHPMYSVFLLVGLTVLLVSANALVGALWLAQVTLVVTLRVRREERALIGAFGDAYRLYRDGTGCLVPRLIRPRRTMEEPVQAAVGPVTVPEAGQRVPAMRAVRRTEAAAAPFSDPGPGN